MKKTTKAFCTIIFVILIATFILTGCDRLSPTYEETKAFKATSVQIIKNDDCIEWNLIEYASTYSVYCNNQLVQETANNIYSLPAEIPEDMIFYVVANSSSLECKSLPSAQITVFKNTNFNSTEIIDITEMSTCTIAQNIRKVIIKDFSGEKSIVIGDRKSNIIFELSNVTLENGLNLLPPKNSTNVYDVIMVIDGDVVINGRNGKSNTTVWADNSGKNGISGEHGENGITVPAKLYIKGDGNLTVSGGIGGNGSNGAASSGLLSTAIPGKGSNGGNGGSGIVCTHLIVDMTKSSKVTAIGAAGGKKGSPGDNGSVLTGPSCSAVWDSSFDIGTNGSNGKTVSGEVSALRGTVIY